MSQALPHHDASTNQTISSNVKPNTLGQRAHSALDNRALVIKKRIASIDILRGLVMLLMLVDHVRERFFYHHNVSDPMALDTTSTELFFTRMTAHLCAPVFVFLTGLSAWLYAHPHNKAPRSASSFLFKRGLFIILVEVTLINFSWFGTYDALYLQVMWAIGVSMLVLSAMLLVTAKRNINYWLIGALGILIVCGHNALGFVHFTPDETGYTLWSILHDRGWLINEGAIKIKASYPVLPWIGVIFVGYFAGPIYAGSVSSSQRQKVLVLGGLGSLGLLLVLRGLNIYGETLPWQSGETLADGLKSFVNFTKYPPSLDYILLTLGIAWLFLCALEKVDNNLSKVIERFGSAPMFFYIVHLYVLLILYRVLFALYGANQGDVFGVERVWQVWAIAGLLALALYYPTRAFSKFKKRTSMPWVKYF
ncbi:heparan-alpha-glucosaminide N-acetyltransferase domain-containing protein [Paraglaciecola sp. 20A4]|uniref:DUF1624 domain-containing protein n=1 Tax=Paraglaciecola sp. 20A4 TaxID=2687288 RepID=UPI001407C403|nr:heparan-alpha-glucosaminide N-acetyltransferase domain-containing protein [Paraglaciecola sp. 20A4]